MGTERAKTGEATSTIREALRSEHHLRGELSVSYLWCDETHTSSCKCGTGSSTTTRRGCLASGRGRHKTCLRPGVCLGHGHGTRVAPLGLAASAASNHALSRLAGTRHLLMGAGIVPMEEGVAVRALVLALVVPGEAPSIQLAGEAGELGPLPKVDRHDLGNELVLGVYDEGVAFGRPRHDVGVGRVVQHLHELLGERIVVLVPPGRCDGGLPLESAARRAGQCVVIIDLGPLGVGNAIEVHHCQLFGGWCYKKFYVISRCDDAIERPGHLGKELMRFAGQDVYYVV